jgi:hypothetical protein
MNLFREVFIPRISDELNPCISISFKPAIVQPFGVVTDLIALGCTCSSITIAAAPLPFVQKWPMLFANQINLDTCLQARI